MTPAAYKLACSRPGVMPRRVVETTAEILRKRAPREAVLVRSQLWAPVVEKPPLHEGGAATDHLVLDLSPEDLGDVMHALIVEMIQAEANREDDPRERFRVASLFDYWQPYWVALDMPDRRR